MSVLANISSNNKYSKLAETCVTMVNCWKGAVLSLSEVSLLGAWCHQMRRLWNPASMFSSVQLTYIISDMTIYKYQVEHT